MHEMASPGGAWNLTGRQIGTSRAWQVPFLGVYPSSNLRYGEQWDEVQYAVQGQSLPQNMYCTWPVLLTIRIICLEPIRKLNATIQLQATAPKSYLLANV